MKQTIELTNPVNISVKDAGLKHDNFKTLTFKNKVDDLGIELSDDNYSELIKATAPQDLESFINAFNTLIDFGINKGWHIHDDADAEYYLSTIKYSDKEDKLYFGCEEIE